MHLFWKTLGIQKLRLEGDWKVFIKQIEVSEINKKEGIIMKKRKKKLHRMTLLEKVDMIYF